jgi:hypothetical protein
MAGEGKGKGSHEEYVEIRAARGDGAPKSGRRGRGRWRGRGCLRGCGLEWRLGHGLAEGLLFLRLVSVAVAMDARRAGASGSGSESESESVSEMQGAIWGR